MPKSVGTEVTVYDFCRNLAVLRKLAGVLIGIEYIGYFVARTLLTNHVVGVTGWPPWFELITGLGLAFGVFNFEAELLSQFMSEGQISIARKLFQILGAICGVTMVIAGWMMIYSYNEPSL